MIVIHLSSASVDSGAGIAVLTLHQAMLDNGIDSRLYSADSRVGSDDRAIFTYPNMGIKIIAMCHYWFDRFLVRVFGYRGNAPFSLLRRGKTWPRRTDLQHADIIHLHWVGDSFLNLKDLEGLKGKVVWTLRDWWPLEGVWHIPQERDQLSTQYEPCSLVPRHFLDNLIAREKFKKASFLKSTSKVKIAAQSDFMRKDTEKALDLLPGSVSVIASSINDAVYKYIDKKTARDRLGLPLDATVIAVGSTNVNDEYKGMGILSKIPEGSKVRKSIFLIFGGGEVNLPDDVCRRAYGFISSQSVMRDIYGASDIVLCPSLFESFGKVALESIACGTPAIVFAGTGHAEIVERTGGGRVAVKNSASSFYFEAEEQLALVNEDFRSQISQLAHNEYSSDRVVHDYIKLYSDFLNDG